VQRADEDPRAADGLGTAAGGLPWVVPQAAGGAGASGRRGAAGALHVQAGVAAVIEGTGRAAAAEDTGDLADAAAACGGMSFTAAAKVLLASGIAVPISRLKPGDKVLATSTRTGKITAQTITAVLLGQTRSGSLEFRLTPDPG